MQSCVWTESNPCSRLQPESHHPQQDTVPSFFSVKGLSALTLGFCMPTPHCGSEDEASTVLRVCTCQPGCRTKPGFLSTETETAQRQRSSLFVGSTANIFGQRQTFTPWHIHHAHPSYVCICHASEKTAHLLCSDRATQHCRQEDSSVQSDSDRSKMSQMDQQFEGFQAQA